MAVNLHDSAYAVEAAIRGSEEFLNLKRMYDQVNADPAAKKMFDQFRQIQMNLQQKQMMGQDISEQEIQQAQSSVTLVQQNPKIASLMQAEQRMNTVIGELNQIIMKPLAELYGQM
ncbi:YlbF family regulator [Bacillus sp. BRMEA1]|uniref:YlbF family regulator n=1 Tax=Neobacillus endophyticus TaxID=2738405 RepID=UPI0015653365|nr:YlbF family regulator [Neobacillus endophyticus]NRD78346.1 YlbF family regulator [Neobacillus endophyticus]